MVQMYNPNVVGKHIVLDIKNVDIDKLKTIEVIQPFMEKIIEEFKLNVVGNRLSTEVNKISHKFQPSFGGANWREPEGWSCIPL